MNTSATGLPIWHTLLLVSFGGIFGTILTLAVTVYRERSKKAEERRGKLVGIFNGDRGLDLHVKLNAVGNHLAFLFQNPHFNKTSRDGFNFISREVVELRLRVTLHIGRRLFHRHAFSLLKGA